MTESCVECEFAMCRKTTNVSKKYLTAIDNDSCVVI